MQGGKRRRGARAPPAFDERPIPVVAIGASAGGLDAAQQLIAGLPVGGGMAFILVQHLDPTHESMMVDLLAAHTRLVLLQAADGMRIEAEHFYVIPPGSYLSVSDGALKLSTPKPRHGARLPFDYLLHSIASEFGPRAVCVILSGTGSDGTVGLKAIKDAGGLVIAQDPEEAAFGGMPLSAIETGAVDLVLRAAEIPEALLMQSRRSGGAPAAAKPAQEGVGEFPPEILELLRLKTAHDFTLYKKGTLRRRLERRMTMLGVNPRDIGRYVEMLRTDDDELDLLAREMLINVTSFFRDAKVFQLIADKVAPELIADAPAKQALRIWAPGCSTGEEAYSLAMIFREQIDAAGKDLKLQVFASDVDPDAVASARDGLYPETVASDVSPERLARFFRKEGGSWRIAPDLRATVVFTVQDVLADPPFSRLDLISCRNLMIYLGTEAQAKVISLFDFALRRGGVLVLGTSETFDRGDGRFEVISKPERIFRKIGRNRPAAFGFGAVLHQNARPSSPLGGHSTGPLRNAALADLCAQTISRLYAPAAVLINRNFECLYSMGPIDRFLRVAPGEPTHDLLAMTRPGLRTKLRAIVHKASEENASVAAPGGPMAAVERLGAFRIEAHPVRHEDSDLILVCFVDEPTGAPRSGAASRPEASRVAELESEIEATRTELLGAIRSLEESGEEQKAINEEALSVNEEFQSTNEELLTSKEELQSLNEELTALNAQLHEALDLQRTTSNDLQNVLYSTDVATIFLDAQLNIRFFTPATRLLFNVIAADVGRPLSDLSSLAADLDLVADAHAVLKDHVSIGREIGVESGASFVRRILPYRETENGVDRVAGVVITYTDITERKHVADLLAAAKRQADLANIAKSKFLAAASHDLRQPLQTLSLLMGLLQSELTSRSAKDLLARSEKALNGMSGMLNALLDLNHIEAGVVRPEKVSLPVNDLLALMRDEFELQAKSAGLALRIAPCSLRIDSDPRLLEQMLRNLVSNALKYTRSGGVLIGGRRRAGKLSIEVWDTGVGIPEEEQKAIFDEHYQLADGVNGPGPGLGLGLAIVERLGKLLGHRVSVNSILGRGSVFAIDVEIARPRIEPVMPVEVERRPAPQPRKTGAIMVIDDDPDVCELLGLTLAKEGYSVVTAEHGEAALDRIAKAAIVPDLIIADFNLGRGENGLKTASTLQEKLRASIPVIVLTGDITPATLREIEAKNCVRLNKPVNPARLTTVIQRLLPPAAAAMPLPLAAASSGAALPLVYIVDDDVEMLDTIGKVLKESGYAVEAHATCEAFLESHISGRGACLLIDAYLPAMDGFELLRRLRASGDWLPAIMITGSSDTKIAVQVIKEGASDFLEKPVSRGDLVQSVERAIADSRDKDAASSRKKDAQARVALLTPRQRDIMARVLAGEPSKNIAADLGISQRTVENHRAAIMKKTGSHSIPALARLAIGAT